MGNNNFQVIIHIHSFLYSIYAILQLKYRTIRNLLDWSPYFVFMGMW